MGTTPQAAPHRIEVVLDDTAQLFKAGTPSPFLDHGLHPDAERFIEERVGGFPHREPLCLVLRPRQMPAGGDAVTAVRDAFRTHYERRVRENRQTFRHLMAEGQRILLIGIAFLTACLLLVTFLFPAEPLRPFAKLVRESITIVGWVAMWRPFEIFLYDWWPLRRRGQLFRKLAAMPVEILPAPPAAVARATGRAEGNAQPSS